MCFCFEHPKFFELYQNLYSVGQNVPSVAPMSIYVLKTPPLCLSGGLNFKFRKLFFYKLGNNKLSFSFHLSPNLFGLAACCISLHTSRYANGFLRLSRLINCCLNGHSELRLRPCVQLFPSSRHSRTNHGRTED